MTTVLYQAATTVADCADITISAWIRFPLSTVGRFGLIEWRDTTDPSTNPSYIDFIVTGGVITNINVRLESPTYLPDFDNFKLTDNMPNSSYALGAWHHILVAARFAWTSSVNAAGPWPIWIYFDGASVGQANGSATATSSTGGPPPRGGVTGILVRGTEIGIPHTRSTIGHSLTDTTFEIADFQAWFGTYINPSVAANFAKFVTITNGIGRPVNPSVARAAFGKQTFLFTGDKNSFPINRGSGGSFIKSGTINNFLPVPSYT